MPENSLAVQYPWQSSQWSHFLDLFESGRLPHALLLAGPKGVGKRRFGMAIAHGLLCQKANGTACGECRQCQFNLAGTHPDLVLVQPEEKSKQIKIDQIRDITKFLSQTSQQGGYKVLIIAPAEAMNVNAANAILKNLEEPCPNTLIILIADAPGSLLPTVRSRCQAINLPVPAACDVKPWLSAIVPTEADVNELLSEVSGRPLAALQMLESGTLDKRKALDGEFMIMLSGKRPPLALAEHWKNHDLMELLLWLQLKLGGVVKAQLAGAALEPKWQPVTGVASSKIYSLLDHIAGLIRKLQSGANPNPQLALEDLLIRSCEVFRY